MNLYDDLLKYTAAGRYPMHMPGHKRNAGFCMANPYLFDVTEVEGTDNLHHPTGVIREEMERMKVIYGTQDTYLLVNGSTCGILAAISACCQRGDRILVARNCHRSVYHAIYLLEMEPVYLYPEMDPDTGICMGITVEQVERALAQKDVSCVVITSPTYEGIVSDIRGIARVVHEKDIPLVVDEAHGAHFAWSRAMPETAMEQGADLVVESLHKTLPALTQTGLLHRVTDRVPGELLERYLAVYETSSPSYVLMGSISQCMKWLSEQGEKAFDKYMVRLEQFRRQAGQWQHLSLWEPSGKEPSKLVITTGDTFLSGPELAERLRQKYHIEVEVEASDYILAMTSIADTEEGFARLSEALTQIDADLECENIQKRRDGKERIEKQFAPGQVEAMVRQRSYRAMNQDYETLPLSECVGRVSAEYAMLYPPGIPFLVPGEEVTESVIGQIMTAREKKLSLQGLADEMGNTIRVCRQEEK